MRNALPLTGRILIIEDEADVNQAIYKALTDNGFQAKQQFDGKAGLEEALHKPYDLILLDKILPSMDGLVVLERLREKIDTPIIMLTACGAEQDRIVGFHTGADDYLPKPFNMTELLLRIEAILRRSHSKNLNSHTDRIEIGKIQIDCESQVVTVEGQPQEFTPLEYELLYEFLSHVDEVLSKPYLYQRVMKKPYGRYDRSLDVHVSNLRSKLSGLPSHHANIKTIRGKGYCFH